MFCTRIQRSADKCAALIGVFPQSVNTIMENREKERIVMKKNMIAILMAAAVLMTGCASSGSGAGEDTSAQSEASSAEETSAEAADGASYTIGISQFAIHGSLDNCREGFLQGLAEEGIVEGENLTVDYKNAESSTEYANQIASDLVSGSPDMICAIATPSAQSCYNAAMNTDIPVIYTAITDPVAAQLANEDGSSVGNITGTSDKLPVEKQLEMIRELLPEAETIGIIYTTSEANSESAIAEYEAAVEKYGFTLETVGISTISEVSLAADTLLAKVDCLNNLTDNTVVQALPTILDKANAQGIPVFGSEIEQVRKGCLAAEGLDYVALGVTTGKMAAQILKGEAEASQLPYESIADSGLYLNTAVAENLGITIPESAQERAIETFAEISAE